MTVQPTALQAAGAAPLLLREDVDSIAVLTLNRPEIRNSLSEAMLGALSQAFAAIAADRSVHAVVLAAEMKSLLIGEAADPMQEAEVRGAIESCDAVHHVIHLRTLHLGPDQLLVAAKLDFGDVPDIGTLAKAIDAVEDRIRVRVPIAHTIYIEPDVLRRDRKTA